MFDKGYFGECAVPTKNGESVTIPGGRFLKPGTTAGTMVRAGGHVDALTGVSFTESAAGEDLDAVIKGPFKMETGGAFAVGDPLTSDSEGRAVKAAAGDRVGAVALQAATAAGQRVDIVVVVGFHASPHAVQTVNGSNAVIQPGYFLKPHATAGRSVLAAADTDKITGISGAVSQSGAALEMVVTGPTTLVSGAAFAAGDLLTADASARGVTAGANKRYGAIALAAATAANQRVAVVAVQGMT